MKVEIKLEDVTRCNGCVLLDFFCISIARCKDSGLEVWQGFTMDTRDVTVERPQSCIEKNGL